MCKVDAKYHRKTMAASRRKGNSKANCSAFKAELAELLKKHNINAL